MILIACTTYTASTVRPQILADILEKTEKIEVKFAIFGLNDDHELIVTDSLKELIKKAELILLFVQPYPSFEWVEPHYSFYTIIHSFVELQTDSKAKTIYISPFLPTGRFINFNGTELLNEIWAKAKLNHFEVFPKESFKFLNPPLVRMDLPEKINPIDRFMLFHDIITFCKTRAKKSFSRIQ